MSIIFSPVELIFVRLLEIYRIIHWSRQNAMDFCFVSIEQWKIHEWQTIGLVFVGVIQFHLFIWNSCTWLFSATCFLFSRCFVWKDKCWIEKKYISEWFINLRYFHFLQKIVYVAYHRKISSLWNNNSKGTNEYKLLWFHYNQITDKLLMILHSIFTI